MSKKMLLSTIVLLFVLTGCNKNRDPDVEGIMYTSEEVYIKSFECGYRKGVPNTFPIIVETEEQLEYAESHYEMKDMLEKLAEQYSMSEYTYIIQYNEVSGEYYLHADRIALNDYAPRFLMDKRIRPKSEKITMDVEGFMHVAVLPKDYLTGYDFSCEYITYPGENKKQLNETEETK